MQTTIDNAGRVVIPKAIRALAGLVPGSTLDVRVRDGIIEIEPAPTAVRLEKKGGFLVAVPTDKQPKLTREIVDRTIQSIRSRR